MKNNYIKSMEEESQGCDSPKTRGGITLKKTNWGFAGGVLQILEGEFDFDFKCICGTNCIIPFPPGLVKSAIGSFLKSKTPTWVLQWLAKLSGKGLFSKIKNRARPIVAKKIALARLKADNLLARLQANADRIGKLKANWRRYENLIGANNLRIKILRQQIQGKAEEFVRYLCKDPINGFGRWEDLIKRPHPSTWPTVPGGRNVKQRFILCWEIAKVLIPSQSEIKELTKSNDWMEEAIKLIRKETEKNDDLLREWQKARRELDVLNEENYIWENSGTDGEGLAGLLTMFSGAGVYFWDSFFTSLILVLEVTSIVQEKNCMNNAFGLPSGIVGASLNPETCECSVCPSPLKLCDLNSWTEYVLPNTPGSRMSDELNVCIECCDNANPKARMWSGGWIGNIAQEFGVPPCTCECPEEVDGEQMEWAECNSKEACELGTLVSDKKVCRTKYPPDHDLEGVIPNYKSRYEWDSEICEWVCKTPPCEKSCYVYHTAEYDCNLKSWKKDTSQGICAYSEEEVVARLPGQKIISLNQWVVETGAQQNSCFRAYLEKISTSCEKGMDCVGLSNPDLPTEQIDGCCPCPPGFRKVKKASLWVDEEYTCEKDCTSEEFKCLPGFCCVENAFVFGINDCVSCDSSSSSTCENPCDCITCEPGFVCIDGKCTYPEMRILKSKKEDISW